MKGKYARCYIEICDFIEREGYIPSIRDLCKIMGLSSPASVHYYINKLKEYGYLRDDVRGIALKMERIQVIKEW